MHCPACNHKLSYLKTGFFNPLGCKCPFCATKLKLDGVGRAIHVIGAATGAALAMKAVYMEAHGIWTPHDSFVWFALTFPGCVVALEWACWNLATYKTKPPHNPPPLEEA